MAALEAELVAARAALAEARAREAALANDLHHRVANLLSVIRSICRRTRESGASAEEFAEHFEGRLNAVARSQAHANGSGVPGIDLEDLVRDELLAIGFADGPRCTIAGPPVRLTDRRAELLGLAIHELATNSIKFGALAQDGALAIRWTVDRDGDDALLRLAWEETGVGVDAAATRRAGFGRQLIEQALPYQLGATTSFRLAPDGLTCDIALPLPDEVVAHGSAAGARVDPTDA